MESPINSMPEPPQPSPVAQAPPPPPAAAASRPSRSRSRRRTILILFATTARVQSALARLHPHSAEQSHQLFGRLQHSGGSRRTRPVVWRRSLRLCLGRPADGPLRRQQHSPFKFTHVPQLHQGLGRPPGGLLPHCGNAVGRCGCGLHYPGRRHRLPGAQCLLSRPGSCWRAAFPRSTSTRPPAIY